MIARTIRIMVVISLWLGMILPATPDHAQSQPAEGYFDHAGGNEHQIRVTLHADRAPGAGDVATLTLTATPALAAPDLRVEWIVPDSVELLQGAAVDEVGAVAADQTIARVRQVRLPGPGVYRIMARAGYSVSPSQRYSALGVLFFTVNADGSTAASDLDPAAKDFDRTMVTEVLPGVSAAAVRAPNDDPCVNVSGRITRWDYPLTTGPGYGARVEVPLRHVGVVIREEDDFFDDSYGGSNTDADGNYAFSFCDDDGVFDDELEVYIRVHAEIDFNGYDVVSVEDDGLIDDRWEFDSVPFSTEGGTYVVNIVLQDNEQSAIMNIADVIFDAWTVWNNSGGAQGDDDIFAAEAEVHYEPGDGATGSFYNGYFLVGSNTLNNDDITIADDPSDPDPYDDGVIIHEWGHFADDYYGCDDNGGGKHYIDRLVDDLELAWGEGYPDYYQSAVRAFAGDPTSSWYLDADGTRMAGIAVDLETYDATRASNLLSEFNELAIAAMLYDLFDGNNDPRTPGPPAAGPFDSVAHGHAMIQEVYTDPFFESNGDWADDTCTAFVYLWAWQNLRKPTDAATAEAVTKNNNRPNPFFGPRSLAAYTAAFAPTVGDPNGGASILSTAVNGNPNQIDHRWWQRLTFVVDNSASMAVSGKFDAVKTVLKETVNDAFNANPKGVEVAVNSFNNGSPFIQPVIQGQFRGEGIYPFVDQMATVGTEDVHCFTPADPMGALRQGAQDQTRGQVWLYTDTDGFTNQQGLIRSQLNRQQMRASIALLGGCTPSGRRQSDLTGDEEAYLLLAADGSQGAGIVPYLLTALGTGGQFLYVNPDQLADASDILRAQLANSAGAGKWSDYVSDVFTYRWDRLEPSEYHWITGLADQGQLSDTGFIRVNVPDNVFFWGDETSAVDVYQDGQIHMNPCLSAIPDLCLFGFSQYANILNKDLSWYYVPPGPRAASAESTQAVNAPESLDQQTTGWFVHVYTGQHQEWFVISTEGFEDGATAGPRRAYQVWLNTQTGEVRYLYDAVSAADSGSAVISVRENQIVLGPNEVVVSNQDLAGAVNGGGYKFTPAPPMPTRTYPVKADSLIERIGFLQTGYSGAFEPMVVTDPNGAAVTCGSDGVTCYTVDHVAGDRMVQYIEVPNSTPGTWNATIDATGSQATFTFSALAASDLNADSPSQRLRPSIGATPLFLNLGQAVDGNTLTGWFQQPNGNRFSGDFTLYDDGAHGDGRAGDGRFAVPDYNAIGQGVAYLWVKGQVSGEDFERADPVPFNFQPLRVSMFSAPELSNNNEQMLLTVKVENLSNSPLCFNGDVTIPQGWSAAWAVPGCVPVAGNSSEIRTLIVNPAWPDAPSGQRGEVVVNFVEVSEGAIQGSTTATVIRRRPPARFSFDERAENYEIKPDSTQAVPLIISGEDEQGFPVENGTLVEVSVSAGTLAPISAAGTATPTADQATVELINGRAEILYYPPDVAGDVEASLVWDNLDDPPLTDTITLHVVQPAADAIALTATPTNLFGGPTTSELVVTVTDAEGAPVAGALVRVGVSDDAGTQGTIDGSMVVTGTTNATGQLSATFTKAEGGVGTVNVRAELLHAEGDQVAVKQDDAVTLVLDENVAPPPSVGVLMPLIRKGP